jgi:Histidinol-phosphate/aromatic aminotransferase and cobyric acid decarboxylase
VLDEAYFEYVDDSQYPQGLELQAKYPNLIVTRTFSKAYGLAALRVGYSVSSAEFADVLNRVRQPFNVNSLALEAALSALGDQEFIRASVRVNEIGMAQICSGLDKLNLKVIPSVGNFVSFDTGQSEIDIFNRLLSKGVIVRPIAEYGLPGFVRVTVGLEPENARFLEALGEVL